MTWFYKGKPFTEQPSKDIIGMVYMITEISTGLIYVGQTKFWKVVKLKPLKGKKNKRHRLKESKWRGYNSSSDYISQVLPLNPSGYKKEVLILCNSITELKIYEAYIQLTMWVNGNWDKTLNGFAGFKLGLPNKNLKKYRNEGKYIPTKRNS